MHLILYLFTCFILTPKSFASWEPTVHFKGSKISAQPPKNLKILGENIEILNSNECSGKVESRSSIQVPSSCSYLHGLYRFMYVSKKTGIKEQVLTDFSVSRGKNASQTFLVGESLQINAKSFPSLPSSN